MCAADCKVGSSGNEARKTGPSGSSFCMPCVLAASENEIVSLPSVSAPYTDVLKCVVSVPTYAESVRLPPGVECVQFHSSVHLNNSAGLVCAAHCSSGRRRHSIPNAALMLRSTRGAG
eukprot:TRINITY_DN12134_c0_g1_i2.p1 TRINITY_DN12134_c0_g1~~TRINITY_DN12134_c0_g1_i2.p1  ORF type:complete len:130 (-),score=7.33 TRINITY_DN12134_c0_g1_i2:116-469(-)